MKNPFCRLGTCVLVLAASATVAAATPPGPAAWNAVDKILGRPGKDLPGDVHKYGWPRSDLKVTIGEVNVEPGLALGSWAGFVGGAEGNVMAMGDLVLLAGEVNPVLRALQAGGLEVLAVHNHLLGESPQVLYVHFAGRGEAQQVAKALRAAAPRRPRPPLPRRPRPRHSTRCSRRSGLRGRWPAACCR
jgi:hypothetical protein